ncbi:MAG: SDR family oxidoreductase [Candidatus Tectomicrobia bacterium]|uniref:SDR family oxidoreductase n=1 Tax=Tectimicrobiota bacterium TaxID=2528274 RepID=A0A933LQS5_UNCTE|nr:SDR family oxidoreductase [Candidatus Tectomicrobia bacterium]
MGSLEGKIALVTGAARGIGRATALALAEEGARVGLSDILEEVRNVSQEINKKGGRSCYANFDVSDEAAVGEGVDRIKKELGPINILVNNAGIYTNVKEVRKMPKENWEREIAINLTGAFLCIKAVLEDMIEQKWGRIINISSVAGKMGWYGVCSYAASKAGLLGLTKTVALEHGRDGITCNAVLPGLIKTKAYDLFREEVRKRILNRIPSREAGNPEDIANVVAFLASEKARYINGAELDVSAGAGLFTF